MVERLIKVEHLRRYVKKLTVGRNLPIVDRITVGATALSESRPAINYILGGPFDNQYQSKCQHNKLLRVATVKAQRCPHRE